MGTNTTLDATLLVVNREPQTIAKALFDTHQFRVETLHGTDTLLDRVHTLHPDIVLLGFTPPGLDSLTVCRQLKMDTANFLPIIMTGIGNGQDATASLDAGADALLLEPTQPGEIVARVQLMLRFKRQYDDLLLENRELAERMVVKNRELADAMHELQQTREMTDNIVHNLAHELRTPLLQVKSAVAMLRSDGRDGGLEFSENLLGHAYAATTRLEDVVNNLNQLVSAIQPQKRQAMRVQDFIQSALRQLGRKWSSSNDVGRIILHLDAVPPVIGSRSAVAQVVQQLLDNALKFSPQGGPVEIYAHREEAQVFIAIRDHGIGIEPEHMSSIFKAFYQVDSSTTRPFGGAGIGLTIVKMLLDGMDAQLEVKSKPGIGSIFTFMLPVATLPAE